MQLVFMPRGYWSRLNLSLQIFYCLWSVEFISNIHQSPPRNPTWHPESDRSFDRIKRSQYQLIWPGGWLHLLSHHSSILLIRCRRTLALVLRVSSIHRNHLWLLGLSPPPVGQRPKSVWWGIGGKCYSRPGTNHSGIQRLFVIVSNDGITDPMTDSITFCHHLV